MPLDFLTDDQVAAYERFVGDLTGLSCDRDRPAGKVAELGNTPGVYICAGCALWAARRAGLLSALSDVRFPGRRLLRSWRRRRAHSFRW